MTGRYLKCWKNITCPLSRLDDTLLHNIIYRYNTYHPKRENKKLDPPIFEEWNKSIFGFVEDILFTLTYEGFYCWTVEGGVQNVWTNIFDFQVYYFSD